MDELSPGNRPVTLGELAMVFNVSAGRLERLAERHRIKPACRIGRTRVYGPVQIRRIYTVRTVINPPHPLLRYSICGLSGCIRHSAMALASR